MKYTTSATTAALTLSAGALAQSIPGLPSGLSMNISSQCQQAAVGLISSPLVSCLQLNTLIPLFTNTNTSIIPTLDNWMTALCSSEPCNQTAFDQAASSLASGCSSELAQYGISEESGNETLSQVFQAYPIFRELVCLKTTDPESVSEYLGNNSTSIDDSDDSSYNFNTTNGTFCVSNLLEQVEEIAGIDLTINNLIELGTEVYNGDYSGINNFTNLPPDTLCQDCIFAGADIIAQSYPQVWDYEVDTNGTSIAGYLNDTCQAEGLNVTYDGTLPESIYPSAIDSDYPFQLSNGNFSYTPGPEAVPPPTLFNSSSSISSAFPSASASIASVASSASSVIATATGIAKRDVTAAKRRWIGA